MQTSLSGLTARIDRWLDHVFFGAMEVTVLVLPVLWFLLVAPNEVEVSLSAMTVLTVAPAVVGTFRGGYVDVGRWPRPGHFGSMPFRMAYYGSVVAVATFTGVQAQLVTGVWWLGIVVPTVVTVVTLAPFPRSLSGFRRAARWNL